MLFATSTLARRIEQAEAALVADLARATSPRLAPGAVLITDVAGGRAVTAGAGSPLNKVAGLGFDPIDEPALAGVEAEFERRGIPLQVELASLASPETAEMLTRRGYVLTGFENVLGLPLTSGRQAEHAPITIWTCVPEESRQWVDIITGGFASPDTFDGPASTEHFHDDVLSQIFESAVTIDGFASYLASLDGAVAGAASLRLSNGIAQLCGAATLPAHRRRGIQTALLARRLNDAARAGCEIAIVTTQPGSKSQENVQRQGFSLLYTRAILVRSWTPPVRPPLPPS